MVKTGVTSDFNMMPITRVLGAAQRAARGTVRTLRRRVLVRSSGLRPEPARAASSSSAASASATAQAATAATTTAQAASSTAAGGSAAAPLLLGLGLGVAAAGAAAELFRWPQANELLWQTARNDPACARALGGGPVTRGFLWEGRVREAFGDAVVQIPVRGAGGGGGGSGKSGTLYGRAVRDRASGRWHALVLELQVDGADGGKTSTTNLLRLEEGAPDDAARQRELMARLHPKRRKSVPI